MAWRDRSELLVFVPGHFRKGKGKGFQAEAKALRQDVLEERKGDQHAWCPVTRGREWSAIVRGEKGYGGQSWPERTDAGLGCLR